MPISPDRRSLGWQDPDFGLLNQVILRDSGESMARDLIQDNQDAVHIFSGLRSYGGLERAQSLARCEIHCPNLGLMVEPGIRMGWRGWFRPWRARFLARPLVSSTKLVLAMGGDGVDFYRRAGFLSERIFPFMYQASGSELLQDDIHTGKEIRMVYVGKFIRRKGLDLLIRALGDVKYEDWSLDIIGTGLEQRELEKLAEKSGIASKISWRGRIPSSQVMSELAKFDLCMVPSRFEGWGVVVNEAIQSGVPLICSDRVTSRELVEVSGAGVIYPALNSVALSRVIEHLVVDPRTISEFKRKARNFSPRLQETCVAEYLKRVIEFVFVDEKRDRPVPPWYELNHSSSHHAQNRSDY